MLVILNSDVLYTNAFVRGRVHQNWRTFAEGCRDVRAELVIPRTTLYEVTLRQEELAADEAVALQSGIEIFTKYGIAYEPPNIKQVTTAPDIVQLFRDTGVIINVEQATLEDFEDAERRACLHLAPAPPRSRPQDARQSDESDEMRDLLIWAISCRLALTRGGAVLVSRDRVHTGKAAKDEGITKQLRVALDFDEALGMLGAETEAGKIAAEFLRLAWPVLRDHRVPITEKFSARTITDVVFTQGIRGLASARFTFTCTTDRGKRFSAHAAVSDIDENKFRITLSNAHVEKSCLDKANIEALVSDGLAAPTEDYEERLTDLREIFR